MASPVVAKSSRKRPSAVGIRHSATSNSKHDTDYTGVPGKRRRLHPTKQCRLCGDPGVAVAGVATRIATDHTDKSRSETVEKMSAWRSTSELLLGMLRHVGRGK